MSIRTRLLSALAVMTIIIASLIGVAIYATETLVGQITDLVDDHVVAQQNLKRVSDAYAVSIVDATHKVRSGQFGWPEMKTELLKSQSVIQQSWEAFQAGGFTGSEAPLGERTIAGMTEAAPALERLLAIIERQDMAALVSFIESELYQKIDPITADVSSLIDLQGEEAMAREVEAQALASQLFWLQMAMAAFSLVALVVSGYAIIRSVAGRLGTMQRALEAMAKGDLDDPVPFSDRRDEIGKIARAAEVFRENGLKVRELTEAEKATQLSNLEARRSMMRDLRTAFGTVVDASVDGDFSSRVAATFDDEELNGLAASVNTLVATVESGLNETEQVLSSLARTDLTPRMSGDYKGAFARLRDDVNAVADNLTHVVGKLRSTSGGLKLATGEILAGANDLSERTTKQAATIEETSAAVEQLSATVKANARNAETASQRAIVASQAAEAGGLVMRDATSAMERISSSSAKISNIIGMIDDIAFQTNLLALNASVEAARAGEAGKGFAVVAVEVRRLAQSAASASSEVKVLIDQSGVEVSNGSKLVDEAARKLDEMLGLVREGAQSMESIARASGEQASAISEINTAVRQMDEMTQHNAALVEETNAAIEQTESQAADLDEIVSQFKVRLAPVTAAPAPTVAKFRAKPIVKATSVAKQYLSEGNAAIASDWNEF